MCPIPNPNDVVIRLETTLKAKLDVIVAERRDISQPLSKELLLDLQNWETEPNSKLGIAMKSLEAEPEELTSGSILFKLRFSSKGNLDRFKQNVEAGLLARLFKEALITDDLKMRYKVNEFRISFTIVDPWEYDQCQAELTNFEGRNAFQYFN